MDRRKHDYATYSTGKVSTEVIVAVILGAAVVVALLTALRFVLGK
jgi:hypothetical protein